MDAKESVFLLLRKYKCQRIQGSKHPRYLLPDGNKFPIPVGPSDHRSWDNNLAELRRALGLTIRGKPKKVVLKKPRKKKRRPLSPSLSSLARVTSLTVNQQTFGEKIRAALHPTESSPVSTPPSILPASPVLVPAAKKTQRKETTPITPGRVWSPADLEAANLALRSGALGQFMKRHDQAQQPVVQGSSHRTREEIIMVDVQQIESTIAELRRGVEAAQQEASAEEAQAKGFEQQREAADGRRRTALDRANSLQETIASFELARENMEKVRPMLGLLAHQPVLTIAGRRKSMIRKRVVLPVVEEILEAQQKAMSPRQLLEAVRRRNGFENYSLHSLYGLLAEQAKHNGEARIRRVSDGLYGVAASA